VAQLPLSGFIGVHLWPNCLFRACGLPRRRFPGGFPAAKLRPDKVLHLLFFRHFLRPLPFPPLLEIIPMRTPEAQNLPEPLLPLLIALHILLRLLLGRKFVPVQPRLLRV